MVLKAGVPCRSAWVGAPGRTLGVPTELHAESKVLLPCMKNLKTNMDPRNMALRDDLPFLSGQAILNLSMWVWFKTVHPKDMPPRNWCDSFAWSVRHPLADQARASMAQACATATARALLEMLGMLQGKTIRLGGWLTNYLITLLLFNIAMDDDP